MVEEEPVGAVADETSIDRLALAVGGLLSNWAVLLVGQVLNIGDAAVASSQRVIVDGRCAIALSGINGEVEVGVVSRSSRDEVAVQHSIAGARGTLDSFSGGDVVDDGTSGLELDSEHRLRNAALAGLGSKVNIFAVANLV